LRDKLEEALPTKEDNIAKALKPQATNTKRGRLCEDYPNCYVEEVLYEDEVLKRTCTVMMHHKDIVAMEKNEARAKVEKGTSGEATTNEMHAPLLRATHMDLVFEF